MESLREWDPDTARLYAAFLFKGVLLALAEGPGRTPL